MRGLVVGVVVLTAACSARQSIPIASGADMLTTEYFIHQTDLVEGNPLAPKTTGGRVAVRVGVTALLVIVSEEFRKHGHTKAANFIQWSATVALGATSARNLYMIRTTQ